ncbi:amino acid transporter heavy chain SLC3A2 [Zonotrichia leucophrys gambelii]|uniref:amino acid transporter heavy chain SLC3A2 n=1 Tax=Zonotrichia leucophrys gambelii TaxID=257770 RepID=UPI0031405AD0
MDPESPPRELELSALEAEKEPMAAAAEPEPEPASPPQAPPPHRDPSPAPGAAPGAEKNGLVMKIPPEEEEEAALGGSGVSGSPKFTGLGKEELLREAGTPLWARARLVLLVLFWGGWLGMLGAAAAIVAQAPRCQPLPAKAWWELGALYRAPPKAFGGNLKGVEQRLGYLKEKLQVGGLILGPLAPQKRPEDPIPPLRDVDPALGSPQDLSALLQAAKDKGLKVILDLTPNPGGDQKWGDAAKDPQVHQQVQDALRHWLKEEIAGVFLDGIEELPVRDFPPVFGPGGAAVRGAAAPGPTSCTRARTRRESPEGALRSLLGLLGSNASIGGLGWSVGSPWRSWAPPELRLPQLLLLWGLPGTPVLSYGDELGLGRTNNQQLPPMPWELIDEPKKSGNGSQPPELELCTALASLRAHERSLLLGEALPVRAGAAVALLRRWDQSERFLLLLNPHGTPLRPFSVQRDPQDPPLPEWATLRFSTGPKEPGEPQVQLQELKVGPHQGVLLSFPYSPQ